MVNPVNEVLHLFGMHFLQVQGDSQNQTSHSVVLISLATPTDGGDRHSEWEHDEIYHPWWS